jgi:hypothetical protein
LFRRRIVVGVIILFVLVGVFPYILGNAVTSEKMSDSFHNGNISNVCGYELDPYNYFDDYINKFNFGDSIFVNDEPINVEKKINQFDDGWNIETIDTQGNVGKYTSIAVDGDNEPHICYYDETNMDLKYAYKIGSNWFVEIVESEDHCGWASSKHSLALDSNGNPHVVYIKWITGNPLLEIRYAKWTGTEWNISTIIETNNEETPALYPSLALDSYDNPHIVYIYQKYPFDQNHGGVKYVKWNNTGWEFENVCESCPYYDTTDTTIITDSEGKIHISYVRIIQFTPMKMNLEYAYRTSRGWNIEIVDGGDECWFSCIAVDSNNVPHISYNKQTIFTDDAPYELKYAKRLDNVWINSTLEIGNCMHTSIVIDSDDYPHISYFGMLSYGSALKHVWWDGTKWIFSVVDTGSYKWTGLYTSTAIDSQGRCHISYYDGTNGETQGDLKYAWGENITPYNTVPDSPFISGSMRGKVGEIYEYNISSIDQDGDDVYYLIVWGDGSFEYSKRYPSSQEVTKEHRWNTKGMYTIKAKAVDLHNAESNWSTLEVTIPLSYEPPHFRFFEWLLERFPNTFPILRYLLDVMSEYRTYL